LFGKILQLERCFWVKTDQRIVGYGGNSYLWPNSFELQATQIRWQLNLLNVLREFSFAYFNDLPNKNGEHHDCEPNCEEAAPHRPVDWAFGVKSETNRVTQLI